MAKLRKPFIWLALGCKKFPCLTQLILFKAEYGIRIFFNLYICRMWLWIKFRTSRTDSNSQTLLRKTSASCCKLYKKTVLDQLSNLISFFVGAEIFGVRFWELTTAEITIAVTAPGSIWKTQLIFLCLLLNWTESRKTSLWVDLIFVYDMDCVY